jgi:hypothetical protein
MTVQQAFEHFIADDGGKTFEEAVKSSTTAGFNGSGYTVELCEDGTFRVLWDGMIGNQYYSPGILLSIPQFDQDTINDMDTYGENVDLSFAMAYVEESMREQLAYTCEKAL